MIKRIVFDMDNTLIMWHDKYIYALEKVLQEVMPNYTNEQLLGIDKYIVEYEKTHNIYKKALLANYVNNQCGTNLGIDFVEKLIIEQGNCYEKDNELVSVIKHLKDKYDLVVLSNWFTETQKLRLDGIGILDYFTFVSGGDERILKPDTKAFDIVLDGYSKEECLMVGDSLNHDIIPASKIGMPCIWVSKEPSFGYETVKDVYQLKKIL